MPDLEAKLAEVTAAGAVLIPWVVEPVMVTPRSRDGSIQQEIGSTMGIDPSTMVSLIDQLEDAGLARRRPRPTDRRAREVVITTKGYRMLERGRQIAMEVEDEVLQGLSATERAQLLALMRRALGSAPPQSFWSAEEGD